MSKYNHAEAFCLMRYQCNKCNVVEIIWNSRDGITPMTVGCRKCTDGALTHTNWGADKRLPQYVPKEGQLVFVNMPEDKLRKFVTEHAELVWDMMKEDADCTKEEEIERVVKDEIKFDIPDLIEWKGDDNAKGS